MEQAICNSLILSGKSEQCEDPVWKDLQRGFAIGPRGNSPGVHARRGCGPARVCKQGRARVAAVWRLPPLRDTVSLGVTSAHTERNLLSRCACHGLKIAVIHLRAGAAAQRRGTAKEPWAPDCGSPQATSGSETLATRR